MNIKPAEAVTGVGAHYDSTVLTVVKGVRATVQRYIPSIALFRREDRAYCRLVQDVHPSAYQQIYTPGSIVFVAVRDGQSAPTSNTSVTYVLSTLQCTYLVPGI